MPMQFYVIWCSMEIFDYLLLFNFSYTLIAVQFFLMIGSFHFIRIKETLLHQVW